MEIWCWWHSGLQICFFILAKGQNKITNVIYFFFFWTNVFTISNVHLWFLWLYKNNSMPATKEFYNQKEVATCIHIISSSCFSPALSYRADQMVYFYFPLPNLLRHLSALLRQLMKVHVLRDSTFPRVFHLKWKSPWLRYCCDPPLAQL